jgi:hypothetical protein
MWTQLRTGFSVLRDGEQMKEKAWLLSLKNRKKKKTGMKSGEVERWRGEI